MTGTVLQQSRADVSPSVDLTPREMSNAIVTWSRREDGQTENGRGSQG